MSKNDYPVLCGGTFFALLLNAIKNRTSKRANAVGETDGLSQTELLIELVKLIKPAFKPPVKEATLKKNVTGYRKCEDNGGTYFTAVFDSNDVNIFDEHMRSDYARVRSAMSALADRFISEDKAEWLVNALLEVVSKDENISDGSEFNIDGKIISKDKLLNINNVCLPSFILGIWHYIVMNVKDNTTGKSTFDKWHARKGEKNSEWIFNSNIGDETKRKITIMPFAYYAADADAGNYEPNAKYDSEFAEEIYVDAEPDASKYQQNNYTQHITVSGSHNTINGFVFNLKDRG